MTAGDAVPWTDFASSAPELAVIAEERMLHTHLALMATNRRSGWPRVSPVEPYLVDDELVIGVMWQSRKALDLLADDRVTVHSPVNDWAGTEGDVKLYGHAIPITERERRLAVFHAIDEAHGNEWSDEDDPEYHMFAVRIVEAAYVRFLGEEYVVWRWRPGGEVEKRTLTQ